MTFLVSYSAFMWDNYQGASGHWIDGQLAIKIETPIEIDIWTEIEIQLINYLSKNRPFRQGKEKDFLIKSANLL